MSVSRTTLGIMMAMGFDLYAKASREKTGVHTATGKQSIFSSLSLQRANTLALLISIAVSLCFVSSAAAQFTDIGGARAVPRPDLGHDYIHLLDETVSPANGSVNIKIDIPLPPERGISLPFSLSYNSGSVLEYQDSGITYQYNPPALPTATLGVGMIQTPLVPGHSNAGWEYLTPLLTYTGGYQVYDNNWIANPGQFNTCAWTTNYMLTDVSGARHPLALAAATNNPANNSVGGLCPDDTSLVNNPYYTTNGDFETVAHLCWEYFETCNSQVATVDGTLYTFANLGADPSNSDFNGLQTSIASTIRDRNQNTINISGPSGGVVTYTDDLSRTVLSLNQFSGYGTGSDTITVSGLSKSYTVHWAPQLSTGAYGHAKLIDPNCTDQPSLGPSVAGGFGGISVEGVTEIDLPNGTSYLLTYDPIYGLLKQITYPNGGYVQYDWSMQSYFEVGSYSVSYPGEGSGGFTYDAHTMYPIPPYSLRCAQAYDWPAVTARRVSFDGKTVALNQTFQYTGPPLYPAGGQRVTTVTTTDNVQKQTSTTIYTYNMISAISNDPMNFTPAYGVAIIQAYGGFEYKSVPSISPAIIGYMPQESSIVYQDGSGHTLKTVQKTWDLTTSEILHSETTTYGTNGPSTSTTYQHSWPGQTPQTTEINYDGTYKYTNVDYHAFGPMPLTYANIAQWLSSGYPIFNLPDDVKVSSGTASGPASTPLAEMLYSNYDANGTGGTNGNAATITKKCWYGGSACADRSTSFTYNGHGQVTSMSDSMGNKTCYDYSGNVVTSCGSLSSTSSHAFPTSIIYPAIKGATQYETYGYDTASSRLTSATDVNQKTTSYIYNDPFGRPTEVDYPDSGKITVSYNDSGSNPSVFTTVLQTPGPSKTSMTIMDGMGHPIQTQTSEAAGADIATTSYDGSGRAYERYNPLLSSTQVSNSSVYISPPSGTPNVVSSYDALSAPVETSEQDGSTPQWCYSGIPAITGIYCNSQPLGSVTQGTWVDSTNENGNYSEHVSDAFGRLIEVMEPITTGQAPTLETDYQYDLLNNLTAVNQWGGPNGSSGARNRSFSYDSLSRLITARNSESGTVTYSYLASGSPCAGDASLPCSRTDARGVVTNYSYDALNRLLGKTYTNAPAGTLSSCYQYDSATNGLGKLGAKWTQSGACSSTPPANYQSLRAYGAYDAMGRPLTERQCVAGYCTSPSVPSQPSANCATLSSATGLQYCYDLAGDLLAYSNGLTTQAAGSFAQHALLFAQTFDAAGRLNSVRSSWNDTTHPQTLFSSPVYTPFSGLSSWLLGTQLTTGRTYDTRLRVTGQSSAQ